MGERHEDALADMLPDDVRLQVARDLKLYEVDAREAADRLVEQ